MKADGDDGTLVQGATSQIDSLVGLYKNEDEMRIGDR